MNNQSNLANDVLLYNSLRIVQLQLDLQTPLEWPQLTLTWKSLPCPVTDRHTVQL